MTLLGIGSGSLFGLVCGDRNICRRRRRSSRRFLDKQQHAKKYAFFRFESRAVNGQNRLNMDSDSFSANKFTLDLELRLQHEQQVSHRQTNDRHAPQTNRQHDEIFKPDNDDRKSRKR